MKNFNLFILMVYGLCAIPFGIAGVMGYLSWKTVSGSLTAQGVVVDFFHSGEGDLKTPIVAYQAESKTYKIRGNAFVSYSAYSAGETVSVVYKPGYPGRETINSSTELLVCADRFCSSWFDIRGLFEINLVRRSLIGDLKRYKGIPRSILS